MDVVGLAKFVLRCLRVCVGQVDIRVCVCVCVVVCVARLLCHPARHCCERWSVGRGVLCGVHGRRQSVSGFAGSVERG